MKTTLEAAGFFRPNLEKIMEAIERIQKVYDDILLQLKEFQTPYQPHSINFVNSYLMHGIQNNLGCIKYIRMAAEQKKNSSIVEFVLEMKKDVDRDNSVFEKALKELKGYY